MQKTPSTQNNVLHNIRKLDYFLLYILNTILYMFKRRIMFIYICLYIYISNEMLDQKALEVFSDVYPKIQDLTTLHVGI